MIKLTTEEFIDKAKKIHGDKYDYSKANYINARTKVCIICPVHGEFSQKPNSHLNGCGCPECGGTLKYTTEKFIEKARKIHGNKYDYSKVKYKDAKTKVCIICPEHGEFWQIAGDHLNNRGCPKCGGNKKLTTQEFIDKAKEIHRDKYDYSKVEYINNRTKVCIICPEHGEFWQVPSEHLRKHECPKCGYINISNKMKKSFGNYLYRFINIHNDKYDYSESKYINSQTKIKIICSKHGEFWQRPYDHAQGCGCPKCANQQSKQEEDIVKFIEEHLKINNIEIRNKTIISPYEIDIYLPEYNLAIEYNGLLWHSERYNKDKNYHLNKLNECNKQGIRLIHIFEDEYLEHKDIVLSKIKHILGKDNDLSKVQARKCKVREITKEESRDFLNKNHIQGACNASIHFGCFQDNTLIGVMIFKEEKKGNNRWELNRFATDINYRCIGVGGKLFKFFIKNYNPEYIKSFADRRWTLDKDNNLYTKLGFKLEEILKPDYHYVNGHKREHKFGYRKQTLIKKYPESGLTMDMTEKEMTDKLGFYRIWDCGLFKFVWEKE